MGLRHLLILIGLFLAAVLYLPLQFAAYIGVWAGMYYLFPFMLPAYLVFRLGVALHLSDLWSGDEGLRLLVVLTVIFTFVYFILIWLAAKGCLRLMGTLYRRSKQTHSVAERA